MQSLKQVIFFTSLLIVLNACKKGEDDPVFSFRTRKARVEGEWRLEKGNVIITTVDYANGTRLNDIFYLASSSYTLAETSGGPLPNLYKGAFILNVKFTKNGAMSIYELQSGEILEASGEWTFNTKSASKKSKEYLQLSIKETTKGRTGGYFLFNQSRIDFNYRIKELRDKKMVLAIESDVYTNKATGFEQIYTAEYAFIQ